MALAISRYIWMFKLFTNLAALGTSLAQADGPQQESCGGARQRHGIHNTEYQSGALRTHNQFCTTEKPCNHRSLTEKFRQKNNDRQMNGAESRVMASPWPICSLILSTTEISRIIISGCFPNTEFSFMLPEHSPHLYCLWWCWIRTSVLLCSYTYIMN